MNLLNKLTLKNLILNKKRTLVTILGIILSVALLTAVMTMYSSGLASLIKFETQEKGNFHTVFYNVPLTNLGTFENNRGIEDIYITQNIGYASLKESLNKDKPYAYVKGFTKSALANLALNLTEGRMPENDHEILIPTHLKTNGRVNLKVGDTITLNIGTRISGDGTILYQNNPYQDNIDDPSLGAEQIINSKPYTYKIVGIVARPSSTIEDYSAPGYTFITLIDPKNIQGSVDVYTKFTKSGTKNYYQVAAGLLEIDAKYFKMYHEYMELSKEERADLIKELNAAVYKYDENMYLINLETNPLNSMSGLGTVVIIVCLIIVFTSVFCIKNSFDISITEKIKQYGMLASIGATRKQIRKNVFYEATILGLIGIPLGLLSGLFAAFILVIVSNHFLASAITDGLHLIFKFSPLAIIISLILGIITIYLSAFKSAHKASQISPINSIRNAGEIKITAKKLKCPALISKIFKIGGEISYKNIKRNKKKYRTTVISIVVSVFVFIALSSFMSEAFKNVDQELHLMDYNLNLLYNVKNEDEYTKILSTTALENINDYAIMENLNLKIANPSYSKEYQEQYHPSEDYSFITVYKIGNHAYQKYLKSLGLKYEDMKDTVILHDNVESTVISGKKQVVKNIREYTYAKNDLLKGSISEENKTLKIGAVTSKYPFGFKDSNFNPYLIVSDELFATLKTENSYSGNIRFDSSNANKLQDDIDLLLKGLNYNIYNFAENAQVMRNLFTLISIFLYGFIIVISLIGITNIFNTITTNMALRKPEFAMLKSIGMTKKEFNRMIRLESLFIGLKSLIFGIPIGLALSYLIYYVFSKDAGLRYTFPVIPILIAILVVFLLISLIMKYSLNKIEEQNTIETIRNENI